MEASRVVFRACSGFWWWKHCDCGKWLTQSTTSSWNEFRPRLIDMVALARPRPTTWSHQPTSLSPRGSSKAEERTADNLLLHHVRVFLAVFVSAPTKSCLWPSSQRGNPPGTLAVSRACTVLSALSFAALCPKAPAAWAYALRFCFRMCFPPTPMQSQSLL